ncbi:MAG: hypothetical protein QNJ53_29095 [Pleurocapsa sp. MO_192.B19]|nr:hypothetical protein [Pleurocapsa sp. MO_192.B19]
MKKLYHDIQMKLKEFIFQPYIYIAIFQIFAIACDSEEKRFIRSAWNAD